MNERTVAEAIASVGRRWPTNGYTFQDLKGNETFYSFPDVEVQSAGRAAALQALGVRKGDRLGMVVIEPEDFVLTFLGALRIGAVPVPVYPPLGLGNFDAYGKRVAQLFQASEASLLITSPQLQYVLWALIDQVPSLRLLVKTTDLHHRGTPDYPEIGPDDLAFLQYTSGSTSDPKGVMITHRCLIANTHGNMGAGGLQMDPATDKGVTWLPLYHDMGLIGFVVATVCWGVSAVFIPTIRFLRDPSVWFETIHRHRATTSFGPCFAYGLAAKKATQAQLDRWDLACIKVLGCGGEPVNPQTIRTFTELFHQRTGMAANVVRPGYGSAEVTLTISLTPMAETMRVNPVDAERFASDGIAVEPVEGKPYLEHVACGVCIPAHEMAIFDLDGNRQADGVEGEICMRGPSVMPGYFRNQEATRATFRAGWLRSGDLGYLRDGHIYVTGRIKDLVICRGSKYHPQSIEWAVGEVAGVRRGNVVAFSVPGDDTEQLVIVAETREPKADHDRMTEAIKAAVRREIGLEPGDVVFIASGQLPKTSSGKLQRARARQHYLEGELDHTTSRITSGPSARIALARQVARSMWTRLKHVSR